MPLNGIAELAAVPDDALGELSRRARQVAITLVCVVRRLVVDARVMSGAR